jgi:outer membrane immunogenic protein
MRTFLATLGMLLTLSAPAFGAEQRWSGFYLGGNIGYGLGKATADFSILGVPSFSGSERLNGLVGGVQGGYNWQLGPLVVGAELDAQATNQKARSSQACAAPLCGALTITQSSDDKLVWFGTLRGRLGFAAGPFLLYGTGGAGYGQFQNTQTLTTALGSVTTTTIDQHLAWVYGGGIETALGPSWSARLEYLYLDSGTVTTNYSLAGIGLITQTSRMTDSILRAGINYRF